MKAERKHTLISLCGIVLSHVVAPFGLGALFKPLIVITAVHSEFTPLLAMLAVVALVAISGVVALDMRAVRLWRYPSTPRRELLTTLVVPCGMILTMALLVVVIMGIVAAHQISPGHDSRFGALAWLPLILIYFGVPIGLFVGCIALVSIGLFPPKYSE
jgi:hypothetical protein